MEWGVGNVVERAKEKKQRKNCKQNGETSGERKEGERTIKNSERELAITQAEIIHPTSRVATFLTFCPRCNWRNV